jgi:hypothetical protein
VEFAPSASQTPPDDPAPSALFPCFGAAPVRLPVELGLLSWQAHLLAPPPTDLVIVLQRFLI